MVFIVQVEIFTSLSVVFFVRFQLLARNFKKEALIEYYGVDKRHRSFVITNGDKKNKVIESDNDLLSSVSDVNREKALKIIEDYEKKKSNLTQ